MVVVEIATNRPGVEVQPARASASRDATSILLLDAALLVAIGAAFPGHLRFGLAVPILVAACTVAWVAVVRPPHTASLGTTHTLIAATAAMAVVASHMVTPLWYELIYRLHPLVCLVAIAIAFGGSARARRTATLVTVATGTGLYALTPAAVAPAIDVWSWTQTATSALIRGIHPYTVVAPDIYGGGFDFGSTPPAFPYTPAGLLLVAPSVAVLNDYRYALALCLPATVALIRSAARRIDADAELTDLVTIAIVVNPREAQMVALGYFEPLLVLMAATFVACEVRRHRVCEASAFLLLPAIKQYVIAPVILYTAMRRRPRETAAGVALAAVTVVPFLAWNYSATMTGILFLARAPLAFRFDSLSLTAMVAHFTGLQSPRWLAIVAQFAGAAVAYPFVRRRGLAGLLAGSALSLFVCFLLATQAFFNYYVFVSALLLFAAVVGSRRDGQTWD